MLKLLLFELPILAELNKYYKLFMSRYGISYQPFKIYFRTFKASSMPTVYARKCGNFYPITTIPPSA